MVTTPEHGTSPGHARPLVRRDTLTASVCLTRAFLPLPWVFGVSRSYTVPCCAVSWCPVPTGTCCPLRACLLLAPPTSLHGFCPRSLE